MKPRVMTMLLIGAAAACQRSPQHGVTAGDLGALETPTLRLGEDSLTDRQRCVMREFERDSLPGAACMIPCIRDGSGYGIGGGCWHVCYAYPGVVMPSPNALNTVLPRAPSRYHRGQWSPVGWPPENVPCDFGLSTRPRTPLSVPGSWTARVPGPASLKRTPSAR